MTADLLPRRVAKLRVACAVKRGAPLDRQKPLLQRRATGQLVLGACSLVAKEAKDAVRKVRKPIEVAQVAFRIRAQIFAVLRVDGEQRRLLLEAAMDDLRRQGNLVYLLHRSKAALGCSGEGDHGALVPRLLHGLLELVLQQLEHPRHVNRVSDGVSKTKVVGHFRDIPSQRPLERRKKQTLVLRLRRPVSNCRAEVLRVRANALLDLPEAVIICVDVFCIPVVIVDVKHGHQPAAAFDVDLLRSSRSDHET
eukprot:scaffold926_cov248-Pinguiococcus_pyrenoidosus.AAC.26